MDMCWYDLSLFWWGIREPQHLQKILQLWLHRYPCLLLPMQHGSGHFLTTIRNVPLESVCSVNIPSQKCTPWMNALCATDPKAQSSAMILFDHKWRITGHWKAYHSARANVMHAMQTIYIWTYDCTVLQPFIVPLKAALQALACPSKYHDNEYFLMPIKDARSDDYAPWTPSSEECVHPIKVGSRNGWSFPLLIMTNDNSNITTMLHVVPTTCINIHRDLL